MSWARMDDRYDDNRKVKRAWRRSPRAIGLHAMAITYCARHRTDGLVDIDWIEEKVPAKPERDKAITTLVDVGLFEPVDEEHWQVHDFLDYNPSAAESDAQRQSKAEAGRRGGLAKAGKQDAGDDSGSSQAGANGSALAGAKQVPCSSSAPVPSRPVPTKEKSARARSSSSSKASKVVQRAEASGFPEWLLDHSVTTERTAPASGTRAYAALAGQFTACLDEGHDLGALKLATRAAHASDFRRANGYDKAESVLRVTKVHDLIEDGKRAVAGAAGTAGLDAERRRKLVGQ